MILSKSSNLFSVIVSYSNVTNYIFMLKKIVNVVHCYAAVYNWYVGSTF